MTPLWLLALGALAGEGTAQTNDIQLIQNDTRIFVDILAAGETITWTGPSTVNVFGPFANPTPDTAQGAAVGSIASGGTFTPTGGTGAYLLRLTGSDPCPDTADNFDTCPWDVTVNNRSPNTGRGRVWSFEWGFNAQRFTLDHAVGICDGLGQNCIGAFYAVVDGGEVGHNAVVQMQTYGLAGYIYEIGANRFGTVALSGGVEVGNARGRSVNECDTYVDLGNNQFRCDDDPRWALEPEYRVYLLPPEAATGGYNPVEPVLGAFDTDIVSTTGCDYLSYGTATAEISFESNVSGTYHLVCDIGGPLGIPDGEFDLTSDDDVHLIGEAFPGTNFVDWDITDNVGRPIGGPCLPSPYPGCYLPAEFSRTYDCQIILTVGEFHYVGRDMETSYRGLGLYHVTQGTSALERDPLRMYWNDAEVQDIALMPNVGGISAESSGPLGIRAQDYLATPTALTTVPCTTVNILFSESNPLACNSRAWGNQSGGANGSPANKGDQSYLDTYTFVDSDASVTFELEIVSTFYDTDLDTLPDAAEECEYGTDAALPDTDADGLRDDVEVFGACDALDADSDDDGLEDGDEMPTPTTNSDGTCSSAVCQRDDLVDCVDPDDDGDSVPTATERTAEGGDADDDDIPNHLDVDDDNDHVYTQDEAGLNTDLDALPDYLDPDDDDDCIDTIDEDYVSSSGNPPPDGDPTNDDTDDDGDADYLDDDDDGDCIPTCVELAAAGDGADYLNPDDDGDGIDSCIEGDGDPDDDGLPNYLDPDSDGDGLSDETEGTGNTDGDEFPDFLDTDDDGDGIPTEEELQGDPANPPDSDDDGTPDHLDDDDDDDGIPTLEEGGFDDDFDDDETPNHLDLDSDGDTLPDSLEGTVNTDNTDGPDFLDLDSDGDGVPDETEGTKDTDEDGTRDSIDTDDDGDSIPTLTEGTVDSDEDGTPDYLDTDDDDDGIPTFDEANFEDPSRDDWDDADDDGTPNWLDLDSDGDGQSDEIEGQDDFDGDGIPDYLDPDGEYSTYYHGTCVLGSTTGRMVPTLPWLAFGLVSFCVVRRRRPEVP